MSQYNAILAERRFPLVGHTDRPCFERVQHNHWPPYYDPSPQLTGPVTVYHSAPSDNNTWQDNVNSPHTSAPPASQTNIAPHPNAFQSLTEYPESSQRTILTSSPDDIDVGVLHPIYDYRRSQSSSHSSDYNHHSTLWDANTLTVDEFQYPHLEMHAEDTEEAIIETQSSESRQTSPPASVSVTSSLHPSVKVEPEDLDVCFIMELPSMSPSLALSVSGMNQIFAPPTEVPLRATQAPPKMREMMNVFRLNPFTMHSGEGRGVMPALWYGGGPLEEEPTTHEYQLDSYVPDVPGDKQFDHAGITSGSSESPTDSLGSEEEAQLRSFSPSFDLHPEDLGSDIGEEHEQERENCTDPDQQYEWSDVECGNQSEVDTSSTTHSVHTPSETRSAHNESLVYQYPITPSTWEIDPYQAHGEEYLPPAEKIERGHNRHRVRNASHPYLRSNFVNRQASPSSSTHSLSQSYPHLPTHPQLNFTYPVLQQPTHHHHQHYNHVPSQNHSNQNYSHHSTVHDSMISAPLSNLELIPVPSHRPENSMYSSYTRSGRTMKLAEDETSTSHQQPTGIVNEYTPRGTASNIYASQHDTHASGDQYEHLSSSSSGHVLSPTRRWSLPETIGPFRSTM